MIVAEVSVSLMIETAFDSSPLSLRIFHSPFRDESSGVTDALTFTFSPFIRWKTEEERDMFLEFPITSTYALARRVL